MKIICVGRNYMDHVAEMNNKVPKTPVIFMKPKSALVVVNKPLVHPDYTIDWEYEAEIVLRICKNGKHFLAEEAPMYYNAFTLGLDMTCRDIQNDLKSKGLPWEMAKATDGSAFVGEFYKINELIDIQNLNFSLNKNGQEVQKANTSQMIFKINDLLAYISNFFTLNIGDYVFTGTPAGVGTVDPGDTLEGFISEERVFKIGVR